MTEPAPSGGPAASACGATCGVTRERARQQRAARAAAERAYPGMRYRARPATASEPTSADEQAALALELAAALPARVLTQPADAGLADSLYVLAGLHAPCGLELRAGVAHAVVGAAPERETYLRVVFSPVGRYVTLQEVRVTLAWAADGGWIEERLLPGVEDRRLQLFVKAAQGLLRRRKLVALDAAFLAEPTPDPGGVAARRDGASPTLRSLLFERAPAGMVRGEFARTG